MHANNRRAAAMTRVAIDVPVRRAEQSALRTKSSHAKGLESQLLPNLTPLYVNQSCRRDCRCGPQILNSPAQCIRLIRYSMPS